MAIRTASSAESGARRGWVVLILLVAIFAAALFLRTYWNVDAAQQNGHFVLSSGSDPYYEKRAVDAIQAHGYHTLINDPLLNYPFGAVNPNPPLYQWSIAVTGHMLAPLFSAHPEMGLSQEQYATWWVTEWAPAVFGSLTLIPIYFMGAALFDRRVGVIAALFWAFATEAIDVTGLGDSRHYAAAMFFSSLAFLFYIKTIQQFRGDGNWIGDWRNGGMIARGIGAVFRERRLGFGYAMLTGMSIAAVALMWKGFPYIIGIMFVFAVLQMIVDHWRNRDSTGIFLATLLAMLLGTIVAYPYYAQAGITNFLTPVWFIIAGFVVAGVVMVPTRDLPTILVFPAALVVGLLGVVAAFYLLPQVAQGLLYSTVYFKQTALYETIAEAHSADFSNLVFSIGPVPFFLAIFGWVFLAFTMRRHPTRAMLFALVWGAIAVYMAHSAVRFIFNAVPVFALFGAYMLVWLWDWLDFHTVRKSLAANRGSFWTGLRKGVGPLQVIAVVLIALLLVVPNVLLAADAAIPPQDEQKYAQKGNGFVQDLFTKRMGAYGQGFLPDYWLESLTWLDKYDANTTNLADRPAFLAWWDYGHWAIAVGNHPTVADNFQNGYKNAAYFILSQNETQAVQLLAARTGGVLSDAKLQTLLTDAGSKDAAADLKTMRTMGCQTQDASCRTGFLADLDLANSVKLLSAVEKESGKKIRYFTTDIRMLPYDNPQTSSIEQSSIYYAPVKLAEQDPDSYVTLKVNVGGTHGDKGDGWVTNQQFEKLAKNPVARVQPTAERLDYQQSFFNSMYWHGFAGSPVCDATFSVAGCIQGPFPVTGDKVVPSVNVPRPAYGMEHFRVIYASNAVRILSYYPGATVSGTITLDGSPLSGVTLTAFDDAGTMLYPIIDPSIQAQITPQDLNIPHGTTKSDASGHYSLIAPFAMEGGNVTLVATKDGVEVGRQALAITREDAEAQKSFTQDLTVERGNVTGLVYKDADGDNQYNATNDTPVSGVQVIIAGQSATTDAEGKYTITGITPGLQSVNVTSAQYQASPGFSQVRVRPANTTTFDIATTPKPATVHGLVSTTAGPAGFADLSFAKDANATGPNGAIAKTEVADSSGNYTVQLVPGSYVVTATYKDPSGDSWTSTASFVVATGEDKTLDLTLAKSA